MSNLCKEYIAQIRNANVAMFGIIKKIAHRKITEIQGLILIEKELERQRKYLSDLATEAL